MIQPDWIEKDERLWFQNLPPLLVGLHQAVRFYSPDLMSFHRLE